MYNGNAEGFGSNGVGQIKDDVIPVLILDQLRMFVVHLINNKVGHLVAEGNVNMSSLSILMTSIEPILRLWLAGWQALLFAHGC